jgi:subtilisin family serine protease
MSCAELVSRFNPRIFGSKVSSTTATVPYLRYETTIGVEIAEPSAAQTALGDLFGNEAVMSGSNTVIHTLDPGVLSDSFKTLDAGRATADQFLDGIGANIKPIGKLKSYSSHAEGPLAPEVQGLFKLISYNYGPGNDLPDIYREPVAIGIIDTTIEKGHCDWPEVHFGSGAKLQVEEENECGAMSDGLLDRRDHVMLIGGIIAAKGRRNASVGMNPYADLVFMPIDPDGTDQNEAQFLIQTFMKPETISLEIVNLSSGLNRSEMVGSAEMLKFAIGALQDLVLVVTAAGNEGLDLSQDCIVVPACMNELDNVISVVGVNRDEDDPAIWRTQAAGSNTHPNFDIGAVAQDVYSTVSGNRYGKDSGTSFAVPQVSAAASLVLAAAKRAWSAELDGARILPKFIKDRLVYTADIKPGLNGRMRSGRLNVSRAIEVAHDQYVLFDGRVIIGQTLERPNWFKCQTPVADEADQLFWNLRRMTYQEDTGRHFLFKHRPDDQHIGDRNAPLTEFQSCLVTTRSPTVSVLTSPGTVVDFTFGDIKDFTSRMIEAL